MDDENNRFSAILAALEVRSKAILISVVHDTRHDRIYSFANVFSVQDETARLQSMLGTKEQLQQSRQLNLAPRYLSEEELSNLESSVKKNTTLNKKLRALNDSNVTDAVIKDITSTNQSRFLPEAAIALVQGTLKVSIVANVMRVCCCWTHLTVLV